MSIKPSPAATVILARDRNSKLEVLLLQRSCNASFLPNYWVFPGGAVDQQDLPNGNEMERSKVAACREANEEAGVILDESTLVTFSHWTAPIDYPKRFATWFFIAPFNTSAKINIDDQEIQDYRWLAPSDALELHQQGKLAIMPPTFVSLFEIQEMKSTVTLIEQCKTLPTWHYLPKVVKDQNRRVLLYNDDSGYTTGDVSSNEKLHRVTFNNNIINYQKS